MAICELKDASRTYGAGATLVRALDSVSIAFQPGGFTVIHGPSGSGKTTLLNLVGLLDVPTSGTVFVQGIDVATLHGRALARTRAANIGFIFQSFNLVPVLTAVENVEMALHLARTPGDRRRMAEETLAQVGLGDLLKRRPSQLSGGQQQRVAVARALVKRPALVIADEPTANLDTASGSQVLDIMRRMNEESGITFLLSTHDPMVRERARRVISVRDGHIEEDDVREPPAVVTGGR